MKFCAQLPSLGSLLVVDLTSQRCAFLQLSANAYVFPDLMGVSVTALPDIRTSVIIADGHF